MSDLIVTSLPENFRSRKQFNTLPGDVYNICERIHDKYPTLIVTFKDDGSDQPYVISEHCRDGVIRFVARYEKLDGRIIEDLDYMQRVPFKERMRVSQERADRHNAEIAKPDPEKQEKFAAEFRQDLIRAGFVHGAASGGRVRPTSKKARLNG